MTKHVYDAVILGAGYGGVGQAAQLVRNGFDDFVVLEKADRIGGVWRDNTYPGAACDTQSVIYCFSYFLPLRVTKMYIDQPELLAYLQSLAVEFGIEKHIRFRSEVTRALWIEEDALWEITTKTGEKYLARAFIPAWGQLSVPSIPVFPGAEDYEGVAFHSARWNHGVSLEGKKVASIGAAASAVQYVPEIARQAKELTVFQRSANYILPRDQKVFTEVETDAFIADPERFRAVRERIHQMRESGFERIRSDTTAQAEGVRDATEHLEAQIVDIELRRKLTPNYEFGCKRILRSDDFYPALALSTVEVVTEQIEKFTPTGIMTIDGIFHELDVVVFGTGFKSQAFQGDIEIIGRDGLSLDQRWNNAPEAYLGLTVDQFPNLFMVYGPNTNLNHNTIAAMLEVQHDYIVQAVDYISKHPRFVFDVRPDVLRHFNDWVQEELEQSSYSADCSSWYKNADGRVINNWSGTVEEYKQLATKIDLNDFLPMSEYSTVGV